MTGPRYTSTTSSAGGHGSGRPIARCDRPSPAASTGYVDATAATRRPPGHEARSTAGTRPEVVDHLRECPLVDTVRSRHGGQLLDASTATVGSVSTQLQSARPSASRFPVSMRVIAIDGPAGSGKSTVARHLAAGSGSSTSTPARCTGRSRSPRCAPMSIPATSTPSPSSPGARRSTSRWARSRSTASTPPSRSGAPRSRGP